MQAISDYVARTTRVVGAGNFGEVFIVFVSSCMVVFISGCYFVSNLPGFFCPTERS